MLRDSSNSIHACILVCTSTGLVAACVAQPWCMGFAVEFVQVSASKVHAPPVYMHQGGVCSRTHVAHQASKHLCLCLHWPMAGGRHSGWQAHVRTCDRAEAGQHNSVGPVPGAVHILSVIAQCTAQEVPNPVLLLQLAVSCPPCSCGLSPCASAPAICCARGPSKLVVADTPIHKGAAVSMADLPCVLAGCRCGTCRSVRTRM